MSSSTHIVLFGDYTLNTARGCLLRDGKPIHLRPQAYRALKFFAENRGRLVTKEELIREVWDGRAVTDDSLVQCLRDVRKAVGDDAGRHLRTQRGLGYIFDFDAPTRLDESLATFQPTTDDVEPMQVEGSREHARISCRVDVLVVGIALSCVVAALLTWLFRASDSRGQLASAAVLPSVHGDGDPQLHYLSNGLLPSREARHATRADAHRNYLDGLVHFATGKPEDLHAAVADFNGALAGSPDFAAAWTGLAMAHLSLAGNSLTHPIEAVTKARRSAQRAIALDPSSADARAVLGDVKSFEWDWDGADREYRMALELNPRHVRANSALADLLAIMGRDVEALRVVAQLRRMEPLNVRLNAIEGRLFYLTRRYDQAIERLRRADGPSRFWLAASYDAKQLHRLAVEQYETLINRSGDDPANLVFLGYALAKMGEREQAEAILERVTHTADYVSPAELAVLYVGLGDREAAFAALENAYATRDLQLQLLKVEQHYDELRGDPRFRDLELRVGLSK